MKRSLLAAALGLGIGFVASRRRQPQAAPPVRQPSLARPQHLAAYMTPDTATSCYLLDAGAAGYLCAN